MPLTSSNPSTDFRHLSDDAVDALLAEAARRIAAGQPMTGGYDLVALAHEQRRRRQARKRDAFAAEHYEQLVKLYG